MSTKPIFATIVLMLAVGLTAISQTPAQPKHRVVMQMNEPQGDEWSYLLAHIQNMRIAFANDGGVEIEVVFFGPDSTCCARPTRTTRRCCNDSPPRESS